MEYEILFGQNCGSNIKFKDDILVISCPYWQNNTGMIDILNDTTADIITTRSGLIINEYLGQTIEIIGEPGYYYSVLYVSFVTNHDILELPRPTNE